MEVISISPRELASKRQGGEFVELIDVRTTVEFLEVHCPFARNVPLSNLDPEAVMNSRAGIADTPLYVICKSGGRGKQACEKFLAAGYTNVVNVEGGTLAWVECGLPVTRGKKAISLERQVQITTGLMVMFFTVMGFFVHAYFLALPALIGAGLVFAAVTDTCAIGLLLARMPWNQVVPRRPVETGDQHCAVVNQSTSVGNS